MPNQVRKKEPDACAFAPIKILSVAAAIAMLAMQATNATSAATLAAPPINVNGASIAVTGLERRNVVFVPVRGLFEKLGATVTKTGSSIVAERNGKVLAHMTVGSRNTMVNGSSRMLPVAPFISSGVAMLPLRVISEAAGASVTYVTAPRAVNVTRSNGAGAGMAASAAAGAAAATVAQAAAPAAAPAATDVASAAPVADAQANQSGTPWWLWALLALLLLGLILWAVTRRKKEPIIRTSSAVRQSEPIIKTSTKVGSDPTINTRK